MLAESIRAIVEIVKLAPRYLVTLGIAAALLLFGREDILKSLGVYDFTQNYRQWLGLTLVITGALFVVDRAVPIIKWIRNRVLDRKIRKCILKSCNSLTEDEKQIMRFYIAKQTKTNYLRFNDGVVKGLESKYIIMRMSNSGHIRDGFAYNITDIAWKYLNKNNWLLNGTTNFYRTDKPDNWFNNGF